MRIREGGGYKNGRERQNLSGVNHKQRLIEENPHFVGNLLCGLQNWFGKKPNGSSSSRMIGLKLRQHVH